MIISQFCDIWFCKVNEIRFILRNPYDMGPQDEYVEEINESQFDHTWDKTADSNDVETIKKIVEKRCYNRNLKARILNEILTDKRNDEFVELKKVMITPKEDHYKVFNAIMAHLTKDRVATVKGAWVSGRCEITFNTKETSEALKGVCDKLNEWAVNTGSVIRFFDYKITTIPQGIVARWYPYYWMDENNDWHGVDSKDALIKKCENGTFPYDVFEIRDVHDIKTI